MIRRLRQHFEERAFRDWLKTVRDRRRPARSMNFNVWRQENQQQIHGVSEDDQATQYREWVDQQVKDGTANFDLVFDNHLRNLSGENCKASFVPRLSGGAGPGPNQTFSKVGTAHLQLGRDVQNALCIDCYIDTLVIGNARSVELRNCWVRSLSLNGDSLKRFVLIGGGILSIELAAPDGANPFAGSVTIDASTFLPRKPNGILVDSQPYRNLRAHLAKLDNAPLAHRIHALEQSVERRTLPYGLVRAFSALYAAVSDYGNSIGRPLLWLLMLLITTAACLFHADAVAVAPRDQLIGWQATLRDFSDKARLARAVFLAGQSTLNPLGLFGARGIAAATSGWVSLWLVAHGLLSAVFVTLFILAVRRRFKIAS